MMENSLWMKLPWMNGSKHMMQLLSVGKNANDLFDVCWYVLHKTGKWG